MKNNNEDIELRSEEIQEILSRIPSRIVRHGSIVILSLVLIFILLSFIIKYPDKLIGDVLVTTSIPPQKEYARITAKIDAILVKDNQIVKKNTPLAILESTANYQDVFYLKSVIDSVDTNVSFFTFPLDLLPTLFLGGLENDFALFEDAYTDYILNKKMQPYTNESKTLKYSVDELQKRLQHLIAQQEINEKEIDFKKKELNRYKTLYEKGIIATQTYEANQLEYLKEERNYKKLSISISEIKELISNGKSDLKSSDINKTKEEINLLKNVIQTYNKLKKSIISWEHTYVLKSDIKGKVSFFNYWNINQSVNKDDLVFTIIPIKQITYIARLKVPIQNSGKIEIGQKVNIKLNNYPAMEFGLLMGKVENILLTPNKDGAYLINVSLPNDLITSYNKKIDFKQEMTGKGEIITQNLSLIERFVYIFRNVTTN